MDWGPLGKIIASSVFIVLMAAGTSWFVARRETKPPTTFAKESAQTRFLSYATNISPLRRIEVAKLEQIEIFERKSEATLFWSKLKLPDVVVRATMPVEYRYYLELTDRWQIDATNDEIQIVAPDLKPGTPSPDVTELKFEVSKGSLLRNEKIVASELKGEITKLLRDRSIASVPLVRETARKEVEALATSWLKAEGASKENQPARVKVIFADELGSQPSVGSGMSSGPLDRPK